MHRTSMSFVLLTLACISGIGACAVSVENDPEPLAVPEPAKDPLGIVLVSNTPKCTDAVGPNQMFNCLVQAWGNPTSVTDMQCAATACGCTA